MDSKDTPSMSANLVNSVILTLIARAAMILATLALPVAGWMLSRGISTIDSIENKVNILHDNTLENGGVVKLIQQNQIIQGTILQDHETRVRLLEKR